MIVGGRSKSLQSFDATVTVDPVVVNGQAIEPGVAITGEAPAAIKKDWWPWIIGAAVLGAVWWYIKDESVDDEEGAGGAGPLG